MQLSGIRIFCAGIQQAARAISELVSLEWRQASGVAQQSIAGKWSSLKGVLDGALQMGLAMAESTQQGCIAEDQWHALACTVQLAVHCLGIGYCTEKVCTLSSGQDLASHLS